MNEAELGLSRDRPHLDWFLSLVLASGYGAPVLAGAGFVGAFAGAMLPAGGMLVFMVGAWGLLVWSFRRWIRLNGRARIVPAFEVLVLGVLPAWGLAYNHLLSGTCITNQCSSTPFDFRPFAEPEVYGLASGHALVVLAYAISRRRRAALPGLGEMIVGGALLAGVALQAMVALQLGAWLLLGLVAPPVFLPTLGPLLAAGLFLTELRTRLKARGLEALEVKLRAAEERNEASLAYRAPAPEPLLPGVERVDAPSLVRAIAASPILVGLYAVAHAAWLHAPAGALQVFTRTCDHTLSHVPIVGAASRLPLPLHGGGARARGAGEAAAHRPARRHPTSW